MFSRSISIVLLASSLVFAGCAAQTSHDGEEDPSTFTAAEGALSSYAKQLVGDYKSDALYPRFSLLKDGSYTFDTGIRCIKAPCPSGDAGTFSIWNDSRARKYVNLFSTDGKVSRWFRVDALKPVTLVGVSGITGTFKTIAAAGTCIANNDCGSGEQCVGSVCTARPLCAQVVGTDGVIHVKNFAAGSYADADAWASSTAAGAGYGISIGTCTEVATGFYCTDVYQPTCAFVSGADAAKTYTSPCDAKRAVIAAAGGGDAIGVTQKGACTTGANYCSTFQRTSDGSPSFAYYAHTFGSQFEANAWIQLNPGASNPVVLADTCTSFLMCTEIYKPVCGGVKSDTARTFGNQCQLEAAVRADTKATGSSKGYGQPGACK